MALSVPQQTAAPPPHHQGPLRAQCPAPSAPSDFIPLLVTPRVLPALPSHGLFCTDGPAHPAKRTEPSSPCFPTQRPAQPQGLHWLDSPAVAARLGHMALGHLSALLHTSTFCVK